jgi:hypothetical protein
VIFEAAFLYRPSRPLGLLGIGAAAVSLALIARPTVYYLEHRAVAEWMIYRFVVSSLMASSGCLLLCAAYLTRRIVDIVISTGPVTRRPMPRILNRLFWLVPASLLLVGGALVIPSFIQLVRTGATYEHWSRFIAMSCLFSCALILIVARVFDYTLDLIAERVAYFRARDSAEGQAELWDIVFRAEARFEGARARRRGETPSAELST